jgi:antirestriction protein ArdC
MPQKPPIKHGFTRAFYSLHEDYVGMPARERFSRNEEFYHTLFHELVHNAAVRIMPHRGRFPAIIAVFEQIVAA